MSRNRVLIITPEKQAEIAEAVKRAEASPLPLEFVRAGAVEPGKADIALADRKPGFERPASESIDIPNGYRAAFSIEHQPIGLCNHLSVSVDDPARLPSPEAVIMIANAFGIETPPGWLTEDAAPAPAIAFWLEEFEPGHRAVNIVALRASRQ